MAFPLNSDHMGIPYVLTNDPAYAGSAWIHGYEPEHEPRSFNYPGLVWQDSSKEKPTEEELLEKWNNIYKAQWQANGIGSPWTELRAKRDELLAACDWSQIGDVAEEVKLRWQPYRQALRDLPANTVDPENPVWPEKPQ